MLPTHGSNVWRTGRWSHTAAAFVLAVLGLWLAASGAVAQQRGAVSASVEAGFARMVFEFEETIGHETSIANNVLVISLDSDVDIDLSGVLDQIPGYVAAARLDPDQRTLRFALAATVEVSTISARERLYVDLLPADWSGPPPGLPEEVVAELIRRAQEEAERRAARGRNEETGRQPLVVHVGRYPTFSRIVFDWSQPTETVLSRQGDQVALNFDREAEPDLTRLKVDPPPQLLRAGATIGDGALTVDLEVAPGTDVRGFREGKTYVVDLSSRDPQPINPNSATLDSAQLAPALPPVPANSEEVRVSGTDSADDESEGESEGEEVVSVTVEPLQIGGQPVGAAQTPDMAQPAGEGASPDKGDAVDEPDEEVADGADEEASDENLDPDAPVVVAAKLIGTTLRLTFPFAEPIASAAFQRARTLWVVFDADVEIDISAVREDAGDMVTDAELVRGGEAQVLRLTLSGEYLATSAARGNRWIVSVGDLVLDPTEPLVLDRDLRNDGLPKVSVSLTDSGRVHWLSDDAIGDMIAVVTLFGPPRGLIKRQEFVEFTALPTAHGLAIRPHADDLTVRLAQDEVVITRTRGLNVSAGRWPLYVSDGESVGDSSRPGYIDFAVLDGENPPILRREMQRLTSLLADVPPERRAGLRQQMARLLISHQLGLEALGVMAIAEEEDPDVVNDPVFHAMRGIALAMAGRNEEARDDLLTFRLSRDPHIALWRTVMESAEGNWQAALSAMEIGANAINAYPPIHQARFHLAAATAALETGDINRTLLHLDALTEADLAPRHVARRDFLAARLVELRGDVDEAMESYAEVAASPVRPVAAEAEYRRISLFMRSGRMTREAAISALESLSVAWRGDHIELEVLRKLAELYAEAGRYRDALDTMKSAIVNHDESQLTRVIADDMTSLFNRIFLDGVADEMSPIAALGLYYDFRELTPVGRRGDEMIRKLADRLVDVDLLDQAADLLEHQVNNRLIGVARAQVAAELALIYLMSHKSELALRAIRQTRQAVLPDQLSNRRNILEARALADLGRVELAVEILSSMSGDTVERLTADALWRGERWQAAGEQFERILGARWQEPSPLDDAERAFVLRAGIAYALADDDLGLERLRRKYVSKMASSPDANAFDVVTGGFERDAGAVNALARQLSEIETMEGFLGEIRDQLDEADPSLASDAAS